ncbi:hypothetical protein B0H67DRAFT_681423 [Lasiosphaeris hirsuta]|uniref:Uncharacterized protein n=1 Tax=Lasiosphaeris hirsuta TaxID=260670 RepID=A0AA40DXI6_9PEZI|nr:hypothetical protein B0H67DRAFT_681423 [Lasiosphaeris hirsuta]
MVGGNSIAAMKMEMRSRRLRAVRNHVARAPDGTLPNMSDKTKVPNKPSKRDVVDETGSDDDLSDDEGTDNDDDDASTSTAQPTKPAGIAVGQNPGPALPATATNTLAATPTPGPDPVSPLAPPTTTLFTSTTRTTNAGAIASGGPVTNGAVSGSDQDVVSTRVGDHLPAGAKAGIAIGAIAGLVLLTGLLFLLWRRRRTPTTTTTTTPRTDSQILNELMSAAHAHQNGGGGGLPQHYVPTDEKHPSGSRVTLLEAAPPPGPQPVIRLSIASWLRRHHPLKLNPLASARGSTFTASARGSTFTAAASNRSSTASEAPVMSAAVPPAYYPAAPAPLRPAQARAPVLRYQSVWSESSVARSSVAVSEGDTLADLYGSRAEEDRRSRATDGVGR